ncbi:MAG TPA: ABC transporter permease [Acidobacteriaceae bacterium]|jgi:putative ABC transport system permease protein|nr:ABC transporter permease [Acidobacteriaceae bacterium]
MEHWFYTIPLRVRSLFRRGRVDAELEEELRGHIERQTEENVARGMQPEEGRRAALIAMGGLEQRKQQCREERRVHWIDDLGRDLVYGMRMMRRERGLTAAALLMLALGIGANTAILSADRALLFHRLPYNEPGRLVEIWQKGLSDPSVDRMTVAPANYLDWKIDGQVFEAFAAWKVTTLNLATVNLTTGSLGGDEAPERVLGAAVSTNLLTVLGVEPVLGRGFQAGEDTPGRGSVAILSYGMWQRRFAGRRDVAGATMRANGQTYTIVGVMPEGFRFPIGYLSSEVEIWTPLVLTNVQKASRKDIILEVLARLRPGVSLAQAQGSLSAVAARLARAYPETNRDWGVNIMPLADRGVGEFRGLFGLLSVAVGLVLLIACANVANLLLARGLERQKELTVRAALGAKRSRLIRQLMGEGILLSLCGGLPGIGVGWWGTRLLAWLAPAREMPEMKHAGVDMPVLLVALGLCLLTGVLFSVLPALTLSRASPQGTLQETGRASSGSRRAGRLKAALVTGEVALTLALLLCAGDILNSFYRYMRVDTGFDASHVMTMRVTLPKQKYSSPGEWRTYFSRAVEEIGTIPGVTGAAAGSGAPMDGYGSVLRFHTAGRAAKVSFDERSITESLGITAGYFRVTGIEVLRGRGLLASDTEGKPAVAVVNETFARTQFGDANPVGRRIFLDGDVNESAAAGTTGPPLEIVGVVRDIKEYGLFRTTPQMIYVSMDQDPEASMVLLVKTPGKPEGVVAEIRSRLGRIDADQPVYNVRSLEEVVANENAFFRFYTLLLSVFAVMALLLALIGIYAVMAWAISQRRREFGIRLALGSPPHRILALVLRQAMRMSLIGIAVGVALAWPTIELLTRTVQESMILTLLRTGAVLYPALCAGTGLTLLLACVIPARSAMGADPMEALRCE